MATEAQSPQPQADNGSSNDNVNNDRQSSQQPPASSSSEPNAEPAVASPPLPTRHTAVTPGPRAQRFQESFDAALNRTLSKISTDNFASCYPTIASQAPHVLRQVQRGMVDRLGQLCNQEFANVLERYSVVPKLNELEGLVSDADLRRRSQPRSKSAAKGKGKGKGKEAEREKEEDEEDEEAEEKAGDAEKKSGKDRPTPPHLLPAEAVLAAHLAPHLVSQQSQMNARLQNTQAANVALWEGIEAQRREVEELLGALEGALADVDGAAALMDGVPAEELAKESRAVEAEMADV